MALAHYIHEAPGNTLFKSDREGKSACDVNDNGHSTEQASLVLGKEDQFVEFFTDPIDPFNLLHTLEMYLGPHSTGLYESQNAKNKL